MNFKLDDPFSILPEFDFQRAPDTLERPKCDMIKYRRDATFRIFLRHHVSFLMLPH